jgi:hypothetical protein
VEAPQCHGREVLTRLVIDRIVSDKTFWNATVSRSFFQKFFMKLRSAKKTTLSNHRKESQRLCSVRLLTLLPSMPLILAKPRRIQFFSGSSLAKDAAVLS